MNKRLKVVAGLYFSIILLFALGYFVLWRINSSYFIFSANYNETTIKPTWVFSELPTEFEYTPIIRTAKQTNEILVVLYDSVINYQGEIDLHSKSIVPLEKLNEQLHNELFKSSDKNLEEVIEKSCTSVNMKIDSINALYKQSHDSLQHKLGVLQKTNIDIRLAGYNAELAQLEYEKAVITSNLHEDRMRNMLRYYDSNIYKQYTANNDSIKFLKNRIAECHELIFDSQKSITDALRIYHNPRYARTDFFDFLYFSATTATSGGYGDFIPNNPFIRFLVTLEILFSMILFASFFFYLGVFKNEPNSH